MNKHHLAFIATSTAFLLNTAPLAQSLTKEGCNKSLIDIPAEKPTPAGVEGLFLTLSFQKDE